MCISEFLQVGIMYKAVVVGPVTLIIIEKPWWDTRCLFLCSYVVGIVSHNKRILLTLIIADSRNEEQVKEKTLPAGYYQNSGSVQGGFFFKTEKNVIMEYTNSIIREWYIN